MTAGRMSTNSEAPRAREEPLDFGNLAAMIVQAGTPQITNLRKRQLRDEIEASLDEQGRWRRINAAYHADDFKFMRFLIPPGKRVLELGCGMGDLLAALEPSYGVGIDFAAGALARAR